MAMATAAHGNHFKGDASRVAFKRAVARRLVLPIRVPWNLRAGDSHTGLIRKPAWSLREDWRTRTLAGDSGALSLNQ
jgi:hypothetical protein